MLDSISQLKLPEIYRKKLAADIEYVLFYHLNSLKYIVLFGSCARGDYKLGSDLDLLLILEELPDQYIRGDIAAHLSQTMEGVSTDVVFYCVNQLKASNKPFSKNVLREGVILWKKE